MRLQLRVLSPWQLPTLHTWGLCFGVAPGSTPPPQAHFPLSTNPLPSPLFSFIPQITRESVPEGGQPIIHSFPALVLAELEDLQDEFLWAVQARTLRGVLAAERLLSPGDPFLSPTCRPTAQVYPLGPRAGAAGQSCLVLPKLPPELPTGCPREACLLPAPRCDIPTPISQRRPWKQVP